MSTDDKATPRLELTKDGYSIWSEQDQRIVAYTATNNAGRTQRARDIAALIVRAVNREPAFEALLAACNMLVKEIDWTSGGAVREYEQAQAAIALAEKEGDGDGCS